MYISLAPDGKVGLVTDGGSVLFSFNAPDIYDVRIHIRQQFYFVSFYLLSLDACGVKVKDMEAYFKW